MGLCQQHLAAFDVRWRLGPWAILLPTLVGSLRGGTSLDLSRGLFMFFSFYAVFQSLYCMFVSYGIDSCRTSDDAV